LSATTHAQNLHLPVWVQRSLTTITILALWEPGSLAGLAPPRILAAPSAIAATFWSMLASGDLETNLAVSLGRVAAKNISGDAGVRYRFYQLKRGLTPVCASCALSCKMAM
jgi:hypothetical protein